MKNYVFSLMLCLCSLISAQNVTLSGIVTQDKTPVEGALVYAVNRSFTVVTNAYGVYEVDLPIGKYQIVFAFGNKKRIKVNLTHSQRLDVDLAEAVESLNEVSVRAVRVNADSPITHSNFTKTEIGKRNLGQDIPVLMNYLPSVVSTSDAGNGIGYTSVRVRGSDNSRVNVTINGIPYNDQESQGTFWVNLQDFASSTENIQLQRGVGTSTNGSGAFGASLNILTDKYQKESYAEIHTSFGSFDTWRNNVKFSTGLLNEHFEVAGRLSRIVSDGYVDRASADLKSYFLHANYVDDNTVIKAVAFGGNEVTYQSWFGIDRATLQTNRTFNPAGQRFDDQGNPDGFHPDQVDNYTQDHYQLHWNEKYNTRWRSSVSLNYTYGRGYFEEFKDDWFSQNILFDGETQLSFYNLEDVNIGGEIISSSDIVRRRWLDNDYYVVNTNVNYKDNQLDFTAGAFYSYYDGDHFGEVIWARFASDGDIGDRYYAGNGTKKEFTSFAKATYKINDQWQVYGDLQGRFVNFEMSGLTSNKVNLIVDEDFQFFNPKFGLSYKANQNHQLYLSYGRANREPRRQDFENNITKAERLDDFELGWRYNAPKARINTNIYYMYYNDQLVLTGALDNEGTPIRQTSGESYRLGIEVEADIQITSKLFVQPNFALSQNKNIDFVAPLNGELVNLGDTNISFSPDFIAGNQISYQASEHLQINLLSKYVGQQYMGNIDSNASILDAFFTNDLNLVYRLKNIAFLEEIRFTSLINNIFDATYESNGYFFTFEDTDANGNITTIEGSGYYPQAGINFLFGVALFF